MTPARLGRWLLLAWVIVVYAAYFAQFSFYLPLVGEAIRKASPFGA